MYRSASAPSPGCAMSKITPVNVFGGPLEEGDGFMAISRLEGREAGHAASSVCRPSCPWEAFKAGELEGDRHDVCRVPLRVTVAAAGIAAAASLRVATLG